MMKSDNCSKYMMLFCLIIIFIVSSCSTTPNIEPLEKGRASLNVEITEVFPLIFLTESSYPAPPQLTVSGSFGITDNLTVHTGLMPVIALYDSLAVDCGLLISLIRPTDKHPGLSLGLNTSASFFISAEEFELDYLYPAIDINVYYPVKKGLLYWGIGVFDIIERESDDVWEYFHILAKAGWRFDINSHFSVRPEIKVASDLRYPLPNPAVSVMLEWH
ncbi:MAG: hypothetical protein JW874_02420 [Spirochaetales bacterium]|nr:hypothetical protein [Spirochaetales bacterium]